MITLYVLIGLLILIGIWIALLYNGLVRADNVCEESWADIDTELKRRYNLIPNLVETVKGYARHERETLNEVIEARNRAMASTGSPESQSQDENALVEGLRQIFALAESYPDLKANENFLDLQQALSNTEDRIQTARRVYNANVRNLNNRLEVFPSNLVASGFGFRAREYFEVEDAAVREVPSVEF